MEERLTVLDYVSARDSRGRNEAVVTGAHLNAGWRTGEPLSLAVATGGECELQIFMSQNIMDAIPGANE